MKTELEDKLFNDFPLLYDRNSDMKNSSMGFGFECGDGWYELIRELSERLYPLVEAISTDEYGSYCSATQVKEKYGTLRFYMTVTTAQMDDILEEFEDRSSRICEACGKPGNLENINYWLSTTCEEHRRK